MAGRRKTLVIVALAALYLIWGSTYLGNPVPSIERFHHF